MSTIHAHIVESVFCEHNRSFVHSYCPRVQAQSRASSDVLSVGHELWVEHKYGRQMQVQDLGRGHCEQTQGTHSIRQVANTYLIQILGSNLWQPLGAVIVGPSGAKDKTTSNTSSTPHISLQCVG